MSQSVLHPYTNPREAARNRAAGHRARQGRAASMTRRARTISRRWRGLWCTALGWGEEELVEAAAEQMRKLSFGHIFAGKSHEPAIALAEKLKEIAPFPVGKVFFANSGSEANDTPDQILLVRRQCARESQGQKKIISRAKAYHGVTMASGQPDGPARQSQKLRPAAGFRRASRNVRIIIAAAEPARAKRDFSARLAANLEAADRDAKAPTRSPP